MRDTALIRALDALGPGATAKLASELNISSQAVSQWKRVPPERAADVSRLTGIPLHELRPDVFPAPSNDTTTEGAAA